MLHRLMWRRRALLVAYCIGASFVHVAASSPTHAVESETMIGTSVLAGWVYIDRANDGVINFGFDFAIAGVEIRLYEKVNDEYQLLDTQHTSTLGRFIFSGLPAGEYSLKQTQPIEYVDGKDTIGMLINKSGQPLPSGASPGDVVDNGFENIVLPENTRGDFYTFGERGLAPGYVSKRFLLTSTPNLPHVIPEPSSLLLLLTAGLASGNLLRLRRNG
jgi:hypothetical protein